MCSLGTFLVLSSFQNTTCFRNTDIRGNRCRTSDPTSEKAVAAVAAVAGAAKHGGSVVAKSNHDAAAEASVILLTFPSATSAKACAEFVALLGDTTGKIIIDTMNPIGKSFQLELEGIDSLGEEFARLMPKAHVFKAFNTIGVEHMADPTHEGKPFDLLFAGDASTQGVASRIISGQ
jgi:predicted dinucleotide-binding enzyme